MLLMLMTGMRRGEAVARLGRDYDAGQACVHIRDAAHVEGNRMVNSGTTKTQAGIRTAPVFEPLTSALEEMNIAPDAPMLRTATGEPMSDTAFRRSWVSALQALEKIANGYDPEKQRPRKLPDSWHTLHFTPHDLRYTYATILYDAGVDEKTAQSWMGHTDARMTRDLYAQLTEQRKDRSTDALAAHLASLEKTASKNKKCQTKCQIPESQPETTMSE